MALKIRLRQQGCKNGQTYRVVIADAKTRRDGKYVEKLGWYLPHLQENNCSIDAERVSHWLNLGAQMSDQVKALVEQNAPEVLQKFREKKQEIYAKKIAKRREKKQKTA
ncbi:MAG: 30S ribosomal protein S16 [Verrucomicrobia bacterium]|nr:30S ribosomal protein S16 [Verrucomicrobiota bacterium]